MKKRGLTLVELLISIAVLGVILGAVATLFSAAIKNYQVSSAQTVLQRETNTAIDSITRDIKQSIKIAESYNGTERDEHTLILSLPSIDEDENFIYDGSTVEKDYIIYYLDGTNLHKVISANSNSERYQEDATDRIILKNISSLTFSYTPNSPGAETTQVNIETNIAKTISKTSISIDIDSTAIKRNYEWL